MKIQCIKSVKMYGKCICKKNSFYNVDEVPTPVFGGGGVGGSRFMHVIKDDNNKFKIY